MKNELMNIEISNKIYTIHGQQVMLDEDLARLYTIETKFLNLAVKRNIERFPSSFMFKLTEEDLDSLMFQNGTSNNGVLRPQNGTLNSERLRLQFATSKKGRGGRRYLPYVFTEQGVAMLSAILKSRTAIQISVQIINAFVAMRRFIASNAQVFQRLDRVEVKQLEHDQKFEEVFNAIDEKEVYHFGASLKDLGKKWFAFSKFEREALALIDRLGTLKH